MHSILCWVTYLYIISNAIMTEKTVKDWTEISKTGTKPKSFLFSFHLSLPLSFSQSLLITFSFLNFSAPYLNCKFPNHFMFFLFERHS